MKKNIKPVALVVGGTSGLGLEMAKMLRDQGYDVIVIGRHDPKVKGLKFIYTNLLSQDFINDIENYVKSLSKIDLFVYAAGFYQVGTLTKLSEFQIKDMYNLTVLVPTLFLRAILLNQGELPGFIAITSTSHRIPREEEPAYCAAKAALDMLGNSVSLDKRVKKTLVAGPGGMKSGFYEGTDKDLSNMLPPEWVAEQILKIFFGGNFSYKKIHIPREPKSVVVIETR